MHCKKFSSQAEASFLKPEKSALVTVAGASLFHWSGGSGTTSLPTQEIGPRRVWSVFPVRPSCSVCLSKVEQDGAAARRRAPPDAASQTCVGLASSIGGHSRRSRVARWNGMPRLLGQDENSWRAWTGWAGRAMTGSSSGKPKVVSFRAGPLRKYGWSARAEPHRVRRYEATIRAQWFGNAASGPIRA